jgi:hypothetical protein
MAANTMDQKNIGGQHDGSQKLRSAPLRHDRQHRCDRVFREQLHAAEDDQQEAEAVADILDKKAPRPVRQTRLQDRFGEDRKADQNTCCDARPEQGACRTFQFLFARAPNDVIDLFRTWPFRLFARRASHVRDLPDRVTGGVGSVDGRAGASPALTVPRDMAALREAVRRLLEGSLQTVPGIDEAFAHVAPRIRVGRLKFEQTLARLVARRTHFLEAFLDLDARICFGVFHLRLGFFNLRIPLVDPRLGFLGQVASGVHGMSPFGFWRVREWKMAYEAEIALSIQMAFS